MAHRSLPTPWPPDRVVLDGGLSTELEARGHDVSSALWSARLLRDDPEAIVAAHAAFAAAGAAGGDDGELPGDLRRVRRRRDGPAPRRARLIASSVALARRGAGRTAGWPARSGRTARCWPTARSTPAATSTPWASRELRAFHRPRMELLAEAGADVLACETVPAAAEAEALLAEADGARRPDLAVAHHGARRRRRRPHPAGRAGGRRVRDGGRRRRGRSPSASTAPTRQASARRSRRRRAAGSRSSSTRTAVRAGTPSGAGWTGTPGRLARRRPGVGRRRRPAGRRLLPRPARSTSPRSPPPSADRGRSGHFGPSGRTPAREAHPRQAGWEPTMSTPPLPCSTTPPTSPPSGPAAPTPTSCSPRSPSGPSRRRHGAVPGAGGGADRAGQRRERRPGDADRLGQVAGRHRRAVRGAGGRTAQLLHRPDQGAGQREVLRALRRLRRGQRRHADRRRERQRRRPDHRLHRRGAGQHRAARGQPTADIGARGDGRVPLLRRPRPRLGLAGAAAGAAEGAVPADERHPRRRHLPGRGPHPPHRPAHRAGRERRAPGAAAPLLRDDADARDDPGPARHPAGADLRRPLHPGLRAGAGAGADERQRVARRRRRPRSPT